MRNHFWLIVMLVLAIIGLGSAATAVRKHIAS